MKLNIEVQVEDLLHDMFYTENCDIEDALKGEIISSLMKTLLPKMQASIDETIARRIEVIMVDRIDKAVVSALDKALDNGIIEVGRQKLTIEEHVQNLFTKNNKWDNPDKKIARIAEAFSEDLKIQYNTVFASKIVSSMKERGLLKDDVVKVLLEG